jgi:hypothetical protein
MLMSGTFPQPAQSTPDNAPSRKVPGRLTADAVCGLTAGPRACGQAAHFLPQAEVRAGAPRLSTRASVPGGKLLFFTAEPITKLFTWEEDSGGHVL